VIVVYSTRLHYLPLDMDMLLKHKAPFNEIEEKSLFTESDDTFVDLGGDNKVHDEESMRRK